MKIAIDVSSIIYETGVSVYTKNLVENLLKINKKNEFILFGGSLRRFKELKGKVHYYHTTVCGNSTTSEILPFPPAFLDLIWNRLHLLPVEKLIGKVNVFHSSDWTQPPTKALKVTTIHDLIPLKYPKLSNPKIVAVHNRRFKWVKKEVDRIIVPSQTTADDLKKLGIEKERIVVIPEAPDPVYKPAKKSEIIKFKQKFRIPDNYVLAVGITPRKNLDRIIEAFHKMRTNNIKLVVIGEPKDKVKQERGVIYTGHVDKIWMPIAYSGATALVYPSLYEGFGLPILESFSCQTPVITSNFGSMAEVGGKAAILVNPYETNSIAGGIEKAMKENKSIVKKGNKEVKKYSWKKTAQMTLEVYERLN